MFREPIGHGHRQRYVPRLAPLWEGEDQAVTDDLHLPNDVYHATLAVDVVHGQGKDLALPHSAARAEIDGDRIPLGNLGSYAQYPFAGPRNDLGGIDPGRSHGPCVAGVLGDPLVIYRRVEHHCNVREYYGAEGCGQPGRL